MCRVITVGLLGAGTVGSGVLSIIKEGGNLIAKRTGVTIEIKWVCVKSLEKANELGLDGARLTTNFDDMVNDSKIDLIIELIGGYEPARTFILRALQGGKHVVTANKAVVAKHGKEILAAAKSNGVQFFFEAAVGGCVPIIKTIKESYVSDTISALYGILNGTTNYILTQMEGGKRYDEVLKEAQDLGFAEADPSFDVEGKDAAQKLAILASLAFDIDFPQDILTEGITWIESKDLRYASELGYAIKLLGIAKKYDDGISLRVHPAMIPKGHELASVRNELNAIFLVGGHAGKSMLYGSGAGKLPTATVVVGNIVDAARGMHYEYPLEKAKIKNVATISSRYYLRYQVAEQIGVMAQITKILADHNVSIKAIQQKEMDMPVVPVVIITHQAREVDILKAVADLQRLEIVQEKVVLIRIEDLD